MTEPLVSINLVVYNGERYIRDCIQAVLKQTYSNIEFQIFDNNSSDHTRKIITQEFPEVALVKFEKNWGMWPGQEQALTFSHGTYIVAL